MKGEQVLNRNGKITVRGISRIEQTKIRKHKTVQKWNIFKDKIYPSTKEVCEFLLLLVLT